MRAWVEYKVPVLACVDTETREIVRVVQMDEEIGAAEQVWEDRDGAPDGREIFGEEAAAITRLANDELWPAWESGL